MMKQMPFRVEKCAVERAKYRAKMAMREVVSPSEQVVRARCLQRWAVVGALTVVVVGVALTIALRDTQSLMDRYVAMMQDMPDHIICEQNGDMIYYGE